ncbi:SixA phosphatase family protein [Belliella aquatica]|nr:histidine phosphatase family protein [Belliella aquatica]MCH7406426.1 histidine phosphatase family protein [Belliella aquatica]
MKKNKILVVLRHGEADFNSGGGTDFERELTKNGKNQLLRLKELFVKSEIVVDKILSSSSKRTKQTTELIGSSMDPSIMEFSDEVYEAETSVILDLLSKMNNEHSCVLLVGHNPGVSALVSHIADQGYLSIQPGMMVVIELAVDNWSHLGMGTGIVREVLQ